MNVTVDELVLMLGTRDVEVYLLQKQLQAALKKIEELTPKDASMNNGTKE